MIHLHNSARVVHSWLIIIMRYQGKMARNSKICIGIQSQLILPEFIHLMLSLSKEVQRNNTLNLGCKQFCDQFLENLNFIFPYIFWNFDTVKLQKMYRKIYILGTT